MPELPEVETMRRGIFPVIGCQIQAVEAPPSRLKPIRLDPPWRMFRRRTTLRWIHDVGRLGKRVLVRLDRDELLVFEPRMTGLVLVADPPDWEHLRLRLALAGGTVASLMYWDRRGLGSVQLLSTEELERRYSSATLGPDALEATLGTLRNRLGGSRRAIKVALVDQRPIAGIGNLYASEILHAAGIDPRVPCRRLGPSDWRRLHAAMQTVLREAIRHEGSTLADGTYRNALNKQGSYQIHHCVYGREGLPCRTCSSGTVVRIVQAQRSTFYCPECQGAGGAAFLPRRKTRDSCQ